MQQTIIDLQEKTDGELDKVLVISGARFDESGRMQVVLRKAVNTPDGILTGAIDGWQGSGVISITDLDLNAETFTPLIDTIKAAENYLRTNPETKGSTVSIKDLP